MTARPTVPVAWSIAATSPSVALGEAQAAAHYRAEGYAVLAELALSGRRDRPDLCPRPHLVICEVKTRRRMARAPAGGGDPGQADAAPTGDGGVSAGQTASWEEIRFDVAAVLGGTLHVVEDAF